MAELAISETIEAFTRELHPHLEGIVHQYCDEAYAAIMVNVQDYLRENAKFNIKSKFDAQHRELLSAYKVIEAVRDAIDLREAKDNAYASARGFWSPEKAAQYRVLAEARARASS